MAIAEADTEATVYYLHLKWNPIKPFIKFMASVGITQSAVSRMQAVICETSSTPYVCVYTCLSICLANAPVKITPSHKCIRTFAAGSTFSLTALAGTTVLCVCVSWFNQRISLSRGYSGTNSTILFPKDDSFTTGHLCTFEIHLYWWSNPSWVDFTSPISCDNGSGVRGGFA